MAAKTILNKKQIALLDLISNEQFIADHFYFSGGTVLAEFYLHHRLSEDLDFFSENEFDPQNIFIFFKKIQKRIKIKDIDFQQSFNRNLFFLKINKDIIKTEFTYFPFLRIENGRKINKLRIDSLLDIAVNKIFTIYQKPRSRDFIDLYLICQEKKYTLNELIKKAKIKFDWHIDPLQLGTQFMQAEILRDYPKMITKIKKKDWQNFFIKEAKKLKKNILE